MPACIAKSMAKDKSELSCELKEQKETTIATGFSCNERKGFALYI